MDGFECRKKPYYSRLDVSFYMCALFRPYPPTINFLECWIHLSDGSAKVVTLSHHWMSASNDCLREIAVSSNVFENISHPCLLFLYLVLANTWRVSFWLMLSVWASVRCTVLWNGCCVLEDAQRGNSISFLQDPNLRWIGTWQVWRTLSQLKYFCWTCFYFTELSN